MNYIPWEGVDYGGSHVNLVTRNGNWTRHNNKYTSVMQITPHMTDYRIADVDMVTGEAFADQYAVEQSWNDVVATSELIAEFEEWILNQYRVQAKELLDMAAKTAAAEIVLKAYLDR